MTVSGKLPLAYGDITICTCTVCTIHITKCKVDLAFYVCSPVSDSWGAERENTNRGLIFRVFQALDHTHNRMFHYNFKINADVSLPVVCDDGVHVLCDLARGLCVRGLMEEGHWVRQTSFLS